LTTALQQDVEAQQEQLTQELLADEAAVSERVTVSSSSMA